MAGLQALPRGLYEAPLVNGAGAFLPDVALLIDVWWFKFYQNQTLVPLNDLIESRNVDVDDYQGALIEEGYRQGVYW